MNNDLGLIILESSKSLGIKVNNCIQKWRKDDIDYLIKNSCPRFGTGEAKCHLDESVRDKDIYIILDVCNYSLKYTVCGHETIMSPDDHYADLKRVLSAINGKAKRITVIMPFLYEGRQHHRESRESLDCSMMLKELEYLGVDNFITFDAHDPRVQNAISKTSFDNVSPVYQFIKTLLDQDNTIELNPDKLMVISPDEGATKRAIFLSNMLGVNMGMFYKRRDYTQIIDGRNPIVAHEFLGDSVENKDCIIIDDMISSGDSILDVAKQLKERNAKRIIMITTFGLFTNGFHLFDKAYSDGLFYKILTTNLVYQNPELLKKEYYVNVDMSEYIAAIIDNLNNNNSISNLISPALKIKTYLNTKN